MLLDDNNSIVQARRDCKIIKFYNGRQSKRDMSVIATCDI